MEKEKTTLNFLLKEEKSNNYIMWKLIPNKKAIYKTRISVTVSITTKREFRDWFTGGMQNATFRVCKAWKGGLFVKTCLLLCRGSGCSLDVVKEQEVGRAGI